ncbi:hypothetical protein [Caballeronia sp. J97]|uniref:hypothetical protein n=1 Tax=Caballeronia sp. J97 TaxID=2805429 RepID=UPI002AB2D131|nr:hypothetical protein [Caballeronia sp. J97]
MAYTSRFDNFRRLLAYVSFGICVLVLAAYLTIISRSYFFQDDFEFWPYYSTLHLSELFNPAINFGRPITRDLYFFLTSHLLGADSSNYFYLNLVVIAGVCTLIYRTLREFDLDPWTAATAAMVYFYMTPTVPHASWISNSQHTIAHLFSFWFIFSTLRDINAGHPRVLRSALIYGLAMFSNVSSLFALVFVGLHVVLRHHRSPLNRFIPLVSGIALLAACTLAWSLAISHSADVHYHLDLSLDHSIDYARFYDELLREGMIGSWYRLLFAAILILTLWNWKRNYLLTIPLAGSMATAVGMLFFLGAQRTLGYLAIPYLMLVLTLFSNFAGQVFRAEERRSWVLLTLTVCFIFYSVENGAPTRNNFMLSPYGAGIRDAQEAIKSVPIDKDTTFCFAPEKPSDQPGPAPFWIFLGRGNAFWLVDYGDNYKRRFFYYTDPHCAASDTVRVTIDQRSSMVRVTGVAMPK